MKIMVFDVPADSGGALTILNEFYKKALEDDKNEYIFVLSVIKLEEKNNVKVINYPWIKRSWLHRLYFDKFIAHKLVTKYKVDEVLSLQNVIIPKTKIKQTLYIHQPLPFIDKKYKITENIRFWIYQNIISKFIFKSIKKADKIMVQTKWLMNAIIEKLGVDKNKFILEKPKLDIYVKKYYNENLSNKKIFFYPASGLPYKNHKIIVEAVRMLQKECKNNYKVIFTLNGNENKNIKKLKKIVEEENLPIEFIGYIDINSVYDYYSKSILIFPSYIETFGLPMLEAKMHKSPILASNCPFSHEILDGYEKVQFFDPFNSFDLYKKIKMFLS